MNIDEYLERISSARDQEELELIRVEVLGRKGKLTERLRDLGNLSPQERPAAGANLNASRQRLEEALAARRLQLRAGSVLEPLDVTAPGKVGNLGHRHPVTLVLEELVDVYKQMGFSVATGPEIEHEWYNFTALNIGPDHPARDMQDTFYLENGHLPRTHTSNVQIRQMEQTKPPIRLIAPGKVHRNEDEDARHSWIFHQIEGLVVDEGITIGDLKGTLEHMLRAILGEGTAVRLRPNYFPYTEPSVEMDATCSACRGSGNVSEEECRLCGGSGWLELGGAGMIHPQVLRNVGIDPEVYTGFAFGFGPERLAAIKYGVSDVREFWRPNLEFLSQF